jgi:glycolate oxidase iron-sulfur subunit
LQPEAAGELGRLKASAIRSTGARVVAAANPGCSLQLRRFLGKDVKVLHPIELLDASLRGRGI